MTYELEYRSANGSIMFSLKTGFVIGKAQSFDEQTVDFSAAENGGQLGDVVESQRVTGKTMRFSGTLLGDASAKRRQLLHVIAPLQRATLVFDGKYTMDVYPKATPQIERFTRNPAFTFTLYAPFPFWGFRDWDSAMLLGLERGFRFPFNPYNPSPFRFSSYTRAAYVPAVNTGEVDVNWKAHIVAVQETNNPYIRNFVTGETVKLWRTFAPGESAVIDGTGDELTVTLYDAQGNASDGFTDLDIYSTAFPLRPGDNLITCGSDDEGAVMRAQLLWRPAISGV